MKWFDTKEIKDKDKLSDSEIAYLKKPSFSVFGPFNIIARNHWDFFLTFIGLQLISSIIEADESVSAVILSFVILGFYVWLYYFTTVNGKRLAWNRNKWSDFNDFQESERRWAPFGIFGLVVIILCFLSGFITGVTDTSSFY
jgi:uncharacterized membrane protein